MRWLSLSTLKIKLFRANLRGVADKKFFLFRIANLYAYPHKKSTDPCKSLNRWLDNQEVCQQLNISPRARFIFHSIGNSFLGILKSLLHQEVLSGHLTPVCHVPVFSLGGSCWFNPSFSPISTLYIDWSSLAFLVKALSLSHRFSYISFLPLVFQYSIYKSLHFIYKSLNHHLSILRRD